MILLLTTATLLKSGGLVLALATIICAILVFPQIVSIKLGRRLIIASSAAAIIAGIIDMLAYQTALPISLPFLRNAYAIVYVIVTVLYGILALRRWSTCALPTKLTLAFMAVSLVPLGALITFDALARRAELLENANAALLADARQTAASFERFITTNIDALTTESKLPMFARYLATYDDDTDNTLEREVKAILRELHHKDRVFIVSYALHNAQGHTLIDTAQEPTNHNIETFEYFRHPLRTGLTYVSPIHFHDNQQTRIYFSSPIQDETSQETLGVLSVCYSVNKLQQLIVQHNKLIDDEVQAFAMLFNEHGIRIAHGTTPALRFHPVAPLAGEQRAALANAQRLPLAMERHDTAMPTLEQGLAWAATEPFFETQIVSRGNEIYSAAVMRTSEPREQPWYVVYVQPQAYFLAPIETQIRTALFFTILVTGGIAWSAAAIGQRMARPIVHLTGVVTRFTSGERNARAAIELGDETGTLARSFNTMAAQVSSLMQRLEARTRDLEIENNERRRAEHALQQYREHLEEQVAERTAEIQQVNQAKSRFLANMSHELRTPLNAIIGYSEMLQDDAADMDYAELATDLGHIRNAGGHLLTLLNDILDLSKVEAGRLDLNIEPIDLPTLIDEVVSTIQPAAEQNGNDLDVSCAPNLGTIHSDPTRLSQILLNLLSNACKFTKQGRVMLSVRRTATTPDEAPDSWIEIQVCDTGIGISAEQLARIFEPFAQADATTTRQYGGTGLGLAISRHLCRMLGGDIEATSVLHQGSVFTVRLPAHSGSSPPPDTADNAAP
jgi:signal transduction histidine kinase